MSRSLLGKALGLRQGQVVDVRYDPDSGGVIVHGVNNHAREVIADAVGYDTFGRLRVNPESGLHRTGAQFRLRQS